MDKYFAIIGVILILLIAMLTVMFLATTFFGVIPANISLLLKAVIVGILVYALVRIASAIIERHMLRYTTKGRSKPIIFLVNLIGYFILALAVAAALGINDSSVLLSGTLISLVLGLAAQTVLANTFGGLFLIFAKPFKVGERVVISTWQYGMLIAAYAPKYLSRDEIRPSYSGKIVDISLNYTVIEEDSGAITRIPNGIIVQAAITNVNDYISTKIRYEIPKSISFRTLSKRIENAVSGLDGLSGRPTISIDEATMNTYMIIITASVLSTSEREIRSRMLESVMGITEPMRKSKNKRTMR